MAFWNRLLPALAMSAVILLSGRAGYCKAKTTPKAKPPASVTSSITWVTKTDERFTYDVPSNWEQSDGEWYVGRDYLDYDAAFECCWVANGTEPIGDIRRKAQVTYSGIPATQYYIEHGIWDRTGILVIGDKNDEKIYIWASAKASQWKKYEPVMRKILASLKIAPPAPEHEIAVSDVWVTKSSGRFSVSVPNDWVPYWGDEVKEDDPTCLAYAGKGGEAGFIAAYIPGNPLADENAPKGKSVTIAGRAATEFRNQIGTPYESVMIVLNAAEPDGSRIFVTLDSNICRFDKAEPLLRKILATFKIAPAGTTAKTEPTATNQ